MPIDFCILIDRLRAFYFAKDRDITLQANRSIYLGDGTEVPASALVPIGGVIFWPSTAGAIPAGWAVFAALQGRFPVGADGATFIDGASGGAETINIQHDHDVDAGVTGGGGSHDHAVDAGVTATDQHNHGPGTLATDTQTANAFNYGTIVSTARTLAHSHSVTTGVTANDTHSHGPGTLDTDTEANHTHGPGTLDTDNQLSATQSIIPPYHCGEWIQRTS